jgi:hypothetical protein
MELSLSGLPNSAIHVSGFSGEDGGIVRLDAVSPIGAVFSYSLLVWMFWSHMSLMLLKSGVHGMACLANVDPATLTGDPGVLYA